MEMNRLSRSDAALWRLGLFLSFAFLVSSTMPEGLFAASFSALSQTGAFVAAFLAIFLSQKPFSPRLTHWDEAAALFLVGGLVGLMADPETVANVLTEHGLPAR